MPRGFAAALAVTAWATAAQVPAEVIARPSARFLIDRRGAGGAGLASEAVPVSFAQALEGKTESQDVKREVHVVQKDKNVDMDVDKKDVLVHQNFERDKDHEHGSLKDSDSETDGGGDSTGKKKDNVDDVTVDSSQEQHEESVDEKSVDDDEEQELEKFVQSVKEELKDQAVAKVDALEKFVQSSEIQKATAFSKLNGNSAAKKKEQETREFLGRMAKHMLRKGVEEFSFLELFLLFWRNF